MSIFIKEMIDWLCENKGNGSQGIYHYTFYMMIEENSIILVHLDTKSHQKRHNLKITSQTTFEDLLHAVKDLYKIDGNPFDLFVQQIGRHVLLCQENFQHFKDNAHIIKIVKVTEYDVRNCTTIQFKEEKKMKEPSVSEADLAPIDDRWLENDYSSFLADDFEKIMPSLELVCDVKPAVIYSEEEKQALKLISEFISGDRLKC